MSGPLTGFRVVDMTMFVSGPATTQFLASLGADVVKIERPPDGDIYRVQGPEFIDGESVSFLAMNKGKRSIVLNVKAPRGKAILNELLGTADVFVHNLKPDTAERLELGREQVREAFPNLVWAGLSGYGGVGPRGTDGGYDLVAQGELGLMHATGSHDRPPAKAGFAVIDFHAGVVLALAIVSALLQRERFGIAPAAESSLFEVAAALTAITAERFFVTGVEPERRGSASSLFSPYEAYKTADGYVTVGATGPPGAFELFSEAIGSPELAARPEFATNSERVANQDALRSEVEERTKKAPTARWVETFRELGMPCGPIQSVGEGLSSEQAKALGIVIDAPHTKLGSYRTLRTPLRFDPPLRPISGAPLLGEHTREILEGLGYTDDEISDLEERKIVVSSSRDEPASA